MSFKSKYIEQNKVMPIYLRGMLIVSLHWPKYLTVKEYENRYTTVMRVTHFIVNLISTIAGFVLVVACFYNRDNILLLVLAAYFGLHSIFGLQFTVWLARNLKAGRVA